MGLMAGRMAAAERLGLDFTPPPANTGHGALINHITGGHIETTDNNTGSFQPMNVNFGLFPPVDIPKGPDGRKPRGKDKQVARKHAYTARALRDFDQWLGLKPAIAAE